jgi:hypothetical protein
MGDRGQPFWWGEAPERPYNSAGVATICFLEMPICLKTRRAVIKRLATARRVFGLINIMRKKRRPPLRCNCTTVREPRPTKGYPLPNSELADDGVDQ